jgi:protein KRI1
MPTRFKYTTVKPESFGLSPVDILLASNPELNQYVSVKKYAPYKTKARWDPARGERLKELRKKLEERGMGWPRAEGEEAKTLKKSRKGKKERIKAKAAADGLVGTASNGTSENQTKKRKWNETDR